MKGITWVPVVVNDDGELTPFNKGAKGPGVFIPAGDWDPKLSHDLAVRASTAFGLAVHDGEHWTWPPTSQRENSADLHQLSLRPDGWDDDGFWPRCTCGWDVADGTPGSEPTNAAALWIAHLMAEGVL